jgi:membrane associated rhomboid family serine protease
MIPVGDTNVRGAGPGFVTIALIILNVIVFFFEATMSTPALESFVYEYGMIPAAVIQGDQLHTLLTSMFLHGGWLHLISNMLFLWVFGDNIEAVLGKFMYIAFYIAGGLAASIAHILFNAGSVVPSVGASGAIAAVLGAYIVMFPHSRVRLFILSPFYIGLTRVTALLFLGIWAVSQLFNGIAGLGVETAQTGGVAFWAHLGGFVFGLVVGLILRGGAAGRLETDAPGGLRRT